MTKYKYDFRRVYREMLQEECKPFTEMDAASAGTMGASSGSGVNVLNTGDGTSATVDQTLDVSSSTLAKPLVMSINKRKMKELLTASSCVKEACGNCSCENCKAENGTSFNEACKKHLMEFFGEGFEIEEYQEEGMSTEQLDETLMISISKKGMGQETQQPETGQAHATNICQKCNTMPCKCQPAQGGGDPNLNGQQIVVQPQQ